LKNDKSLAMNNVEVETGRRMVPASMQSQTLPGEAETRGCAVFFPSNVRFLTGGLALLLLAGTGPALGQTANLNVTAEIQASCVLNGGSLSFGTYTASDDTPGQGTFSYQCTDGTNITLGLGSGQNEVGGIRQMAAGAGRLPYQLYKDASRQQEWGTGDDGLTVEDTSASLETVDVYGLIAAGEESPPGDYSDTVTITLNID
jgi:spore coat protein U-like protein